MKRLLICATVLLFSAVHAWAAEDAVGQGGQQPSAASDPIKPIYFVSGIADNNPSVFGPEVASYIHCSSLSPTVERIEVIVLDHKGDRVADKTLPIAPRRTYTFATSITLRGRYVYSAINMNTGRVLQGFAVVRATTQGIICSAVTVGLGSSGGAAAALHMVRVNPHPNWAE